MPPGRKRTAPGRPFLQVDLHLPGRDALRDDAARGEAARVAARARLGQREARHLLAAREARQPVALLLLGAVVQQQFAGTERVRHHDGDRGRDRARRQLRDDARVHDRRELVAAVGEGIDIVEIKAKRTARFREMMAAPG